LIRIKIKIKIILLQNDDVVGDISMIEKIINIFKEIMYLLKKTIIIQNSYNKWHTNIYNNNRIANLGG